MDFLLFKCISIISYSKRMVYLDTLTCEFEVSNEIRIVIIGKTGSGKSATGNTILGFKKFETLASGSSITNKCQRVGTIRDGKKLVVVDTPGLFDTRLTKENVTKEIVKCIGMTSPGPHVMVFVVSIGRFTKEEHDTVQNFIDFFGEGIVRYMIVLFTRKNDLIKANQSIDQYVTTLPAELKTILHQCGNRHIAFNNDAVGSEKEAQVTEFFQMVDRMVANNGGSCYTNEIYKEAEATLQRRMKEQTQTMEMQKRQEIEKIKLQMQRKFEEQLEKVSIEKRRLEHELTLKKSEEENAKIREINNKLEIQNLSHQLITRQNTEDIARLERRMEKVQQCLENVETRHYERETKRLQIERDEAKKRLDKCLDEKDRLDRIKRERRVDKHYDRKINAANQRKDDKDDFEKDLSNIPSGIFRTSSTLLRSIFKTMGPSFEKL